MRSTATASSRPTTSTRPSRSRRRCRRPGSAVRSRSGRSRPAGEPVTSGLDQVFREQWARVLAVLGGLLAAVDHAEEAAQEAFATAAERWPRDAWAPTPPAWLITTARNRAV